jgi:protein-tyrosine phosphatase
MPRYAKKKQKTLCHGKSREWRKISVLRSFRALIRVLFICHGNICRSPMAEFILKDMVQKQNLSDKFEIASAATSTEEIWNGVGNPVYPPAREELAKHGISCEGKRAVQVRREDYDYYDYLICMDRQNLRSLERIVGADTQHKVFLLLDFTGQKDAVIADPWYSGNFRLTYEQIEAGCAAFLSYGKAHSI